MGQHQDRTVDESFRPTVLCIDDDPEISRLLAIRLEAYNVNVIRAFHGMHGFWLAMTEKPDLIISDLQMPQGNGDYIVECLKSNSETSHIPVFMLTGSRGAEVENRMRKLGVDEHFVKPCPFDQLRAGIERYISLRSPAATESPALA